MSDATPKAKLTLIAYADRYLGERDVSPHYAERIRHRIRQFTAHVGGEVLVADLDCDIVNNWLAAITAGPFSAYTCNAYRGDLLCVWNDAYMAGLNENPPLRVRKIKRPALLIEAYSHAEIQQLLATAAKRRGYDANGNRRADYWQAMIYAAYSTGLRRGDLFVVPKARVADDGLYVCQQRKTGFSVTVRFCEQTLHFASKLQSDKCLFLPPPGREDTSGKSFSRLVATSGVRRGTFKWLRRAAGSYAESQQPGAGPALLGHRDPGVFHKHYEDASLTQTRPIQPPPMPAIGGGT